LNRREFLGTAAGSALAMANAQPTSAALRQAFDIRGVYFHDGFTFDPHSHAPLHWDLAAWRRQIVWLKACGVNAVEFATMLEFNRIPSTEVPPGEEPSDQLRNRAITLCPRQPGNFEKTIANPRFYMETYREADFLEEFAADWGGCNCGECGVSEFLLYVRALGEHLATLNSKATLYADTWCIAFWGKDPAAKGWKAVFDREVTGSREVIAALPGLPKNVGIALPSHHHYRPLVFSEYGGRAKTPLFPERQDIDQVHRVGRRALAWPHFVMDDDAFRPNSWGIVHSEVRYIQALLRSLAQAGINSVMGNLYLPLLQISNTYAYGRLLEKPDSRPEEILKGFARLIVQKEDVAALTDVMAWMENNSSWQQQMPPDGRLPNLPVTLDRAGAARAAAALRPNPRPGMPLPIAPDSWLTDLRRSIGRMTWAA
jgi:hypothetical protein